MYTGYFARLKDYVAAGLTPIAICSYRPKWYEGYAYKWLAPKKWLLNEWKYGAHKNDKDYYIEHFTDEVLDECDATDTVEELEFITGESREKIVLLCYEKSSDFCHRHLVADWFNANGIECKEF